MNAVIDEDLPRTLADTLSNLGFSNVLTFPLGGHNGICILRFPNETSVQRIKGEIARLFSGLLAEDYSGNLIILTPGKLRIRRKRISWRL